MYTFGVGFVAPDGAFGYPSRAPREKGKKLLAEIEKALTAHIRERLGWLERNRDYTGKETRES